MPLKITQRKEADVPSSGGAARVNPDFAGLKSEMVKLPSGMVLEIIADNEKAVRGTKMLVSKAAKELGAEWRHWHVGATVFAKPAAAVRKRGRRPKAD